MNKIFEVTGRAIIGSIIGFTTGVILNKAVLGVSVKDQIKEMKVAVKDIIK